MSELEVKSRTGVGEDRERNNGEKGSTLQQQGLDPQMSQKGQRQRPEGGLEGSAGKDTFRWRTEGKQQIC